jgi:hypothetical protein
MSAWAATCGGRRRFDCAIVAGTPWLDVHCAGCDTSRMVDVRTIDRHPLASICSLVLGLRCSWCQGAGPMPRILGLHSEATARAARGAG